ncbi:MAG TPA: hypothetical protein VFH95_02310 [Candidatus Kapabacteria bacterium]|nr:hypothetical protein [Candidatus Kapabacteria bacterium]
MVEKLSNESNPPKSLPSRILANRASVIVSTALISIAIGFFVGRLSSSNANLSSSRHSSGISFESDSLLGTVPNRPKADSFERAIDSQGEVVRQSIVEELKKNLGLSDEQSRQIQDIYEQRHKEFMAYLTADPVQTKARIMAVLTPAQQAQWRYDLANPEATHFHNHLEKMKQPVGLSDQQENQIEAIMNEHYARMQQAVNNRQHLDFRADGIKEQAEINAILTPDQRVKWQEQQKANRIRSGGMITPDD